MACLPLAMKRERRFLAMPANVRLAEGSHLKLILKKGDGEALAELVRRIESCRWSLARQNRSHEQRHDDATSRCYSGKHENCEDSAKEPDVGDLDIERRHWIPPSARGLACVAVAVPDPWAARKRYDKMPRWNIGLWSNHIGLCMMFVDAPSNMFDPWSQRDHRSTKAPARKQRYCLASCMDEHGTDTRH